MPFDQLLSYERGCWGQYLGPGIILYRAPKSVKLTDLQSKAHGAKAVHEQLERLYPTIKCGSVHFEELEYWTRVEFS